MIQVIYGEKGTGKTKMMVDSANESASSAKGIVVYLDKSSNRMHDLDRSIRLVDGTHYGLKSQGEVLAFIKGMLAANYDIEKIYIDGVAKLIGVTINDLEELYKGLESISAEHSVDFVITASCAKGNLPPFVSKFIK